MENLNLLTQKLKDKVIQFLNSREINEPYLAFGDRVYSKIELQLELNTDTTLGRNILSKLIGLSVKLLKKAEKNDSDFIMNYGDLPLNQLTIELKTAILVSLFTEKMDEPYMRNSHGKIYTREEVYSEIEKETDFGIDILSNMIRLALDLVVRGKEKIE